MLIIFHYIINYIISNNFQPKFIVSNYKIDFVIIFIIFINKLFLFFILTNLKMFYKNYNKIIFVIYLFIYDMNNVSYAHMML